VSTQTGPDGNLWIMDWCDKYPCYQNAKANPDGVDRDKGRIWRVVYTGGDKAKAVATREKKDMNLGKLSTPELVKMLGDSNNWVRRMARRVLVERDTVQHKIAEPLLRTLIDSAPDSISKQEAFWALLQCRVFNVAMFNTPLDPLMLKYANDASSDVGLRIAVARFTGEASADGWHYGARLRLKNSNNKGDYEAIFPLLDELAKSKDAAVLGQLPKLSDR
jgi:hypothetical protein